MYGTRKRGFAGSDRPGYGKIYRPGITPGMRRMAVANRNRLRRRYARSIRPRSLLRTGGLLPYPSNIEKKFLDSTFTTDGTSTAVIGIMNAMAPGTSASTRIGRRILMKAINLRLLLQREDASTATVQAVRFMIIYDRQTNGVAPAMTDILDTGTITSQHNMANVYRFFTIMDRTMVLSGAGGNTINFSKKYKSINLPVVYNAGTAGTVADINTGGLFFCYVGNTAAGIDDTDVSASLRLRYTDA